MTINEIQDEIIEEFSGFDDWMDKYQLLIDLGNEQEPLDEKYKTEQNLIDGCQSRVWLQADYADADREGHRGPAHPCALRPYPPGDTRCRPLFHRGDRPEGAPLAHPKQRTCSNGEADARLCAGFQHEAIIKH